MPATDPQEDAAILEKQAIPNREKQAILNRNMKFLNKHRGRRCFVLATGPSIYKQDLRPLQNEWCIAVNEFYKHEHYSLIKPAYYTLPPTWTTRLDMGKRLRRLGELKQLSQDEIFFFDVTDKKWVESSNFADNLERVHYLDLRDDFTPSSIDLTGCMPGPQSTALIATWIAMYMGFSEVYLLGCDYDVLWKWDGSSRYLRKDLYKHFYQGAPTVGYEPMDLDGELRGHLRLREQYRWTDDIAARQNTRLVNANPQSYLDILPRVPLESVLLPESPGVR